MRKLTPTYAGLCLLALTALALSWGRASLAQETSRTTQQTVTPVGVRPPISSAADPLPGARLVIHADGHCFGGGELLFAPGAAEGFLRLENWLRARAGAMEKKSDPGLGMELPDEEIAVCADRNVPFRYVQRVFENCSKAEVRVWKTVFEVQLPGSAREGLLRCYLPKDGGIHGQEAEPVERVEITLNVLEQGERRRAEDREQAWDGAGHFQFVGRTLEYGIGPRREVELEQVRERLEQLYQDDPDAGRGLVIDARKGVLHGEVIDVMSAALEVGFTRIAFVGTYERDF